MQSNMEYNIINRYLLPSKLLYLSLYGAIGAMLPYFNVFLISSSLPIEQAGIISGVRFFLSGLSTICFGALADYKQNKKCIILTLTSIGLVMAVSIPTITYGLRNSENIYVIENNAAGNLTCMTNPLLITSNFSNEEKEVNQTIRNGTFPKSISPCRKLTESPEKFNNHSHILFIALLIVSSCFSIAVVPTNGLIDALVIQEVNKHKPNAQYGHQRVFSPIGFMIFSFLAGFAADMYSGSKFASKYTAVFFVNVPLILLIMLGTYLHPNNDIKTNNSKPWYFVFKYCKNVRMVMFLITILICGLLNFLAVGFLAVLLDEMNVSKTLVGLTVATSSLAEILAFFFSAQIKRVFRTTFVCLQVAVLSYTVRFLLFSVIKNPILFLPVQLLQAFGYGLFWSVVVEYIEKTSPSEIKMTMFNISHLCYLSIGGMLGNIGGGAIYKRLGGRTLFALAAVLSGIWTLCLFFYCVLTKYRERKEEVEKQELSTLM